jgi:hypothetical protein
MTIQISHNGKVIVTSSPLTVSTWPTGFVMTTLQKDLGFGLMVGVTWLSESGSESDLGNCLIMEDVSPGQAPNPPFTSTSVNTQTNPASMTSPGSDRHTYSPSAVNIAFSNFYENSWSYVTNQTYKWHDSVLSTAPAVIGSFTITRSVLATLEDIIHEK